MRTSTSPSVIGLKMYFKEISQRIEVTDGASGDGDLEFQIETRHCEPEGNIIVDLSIRRPCRADAEDDRERGREGERCGEEESRAACRRRERGNAPEYVPAAVEPRHGGRRGALAPGRAPVRRPRRRRPARRLLPLLHLHQVLHRSRHHLIPAVSLLSPFSYVRARTRGGTKFITRDAGAGGGSQHNTPNRQAYWSRARTKIPRPTPGTEAARPYLLYPRTTATANMDGFGRAGSLAAPVA